LAHQTSAMSPIGGITSASRRDPHDLIQQVSHTLFFTLSKKKTRFFNLAPFICTSSRQNICVR
jgi:hypothetical protein